MKTRLYPLVLCFCILLMASSAPAAQVRFSRVNALVPANWTSEENDDVVLIMSPGNECVVTIGIQDAGGHDFKALADAVSRLLRGSAPEKVPDADNYFFTADVDGIHTETTIHSDGRMAYVFSVAGKAPQYEKEVEAIWESLGSSDPKIKPLFR